MKCVTFIIFLPKFFLSQAVAEIAKSSKREAPTLTIEAESFFEQVELQISDMEQKSQKESKRASRSLDICGGSSLRESGNL